MCYELGFLLKNIGDPNAKVGKTGIRGLVVAKTILDPVEAIQKLRAVLMEKPYEFRYSLRIIPIQRVVHTNLEEVEVTAKELAATMTESETFRVTVEKRFTSIHSREFIEAIATEIKNKVDLENPNKILLVEALGGFTGISILKPTDIISVLKEKML